MRLPITALLVASLAISHVPAQREGRIDANIHAGFDWLRRHQQREGHWSGVMPARHCTDHQCSAGVPLRSDLELTGLAMTALVSDKARNLPVYRFAIDRAETWLYERLSEQNAGEVPSDLRGTLIAIGALLESSLIRGNTSRPERLEAALAEIDRIDPYQLDAENLYWLIFLRNSEQVVDSPRTNWKSAALIPVAERLAGAAQDDVDLQALVFLARIFAGESPRTSSRTDALHDAFRDERCPLLEQHANPSALSVLLRGFAAFQCGGAAYSAWSRNHKAPLRELQSKTGCSAGAWFAAPAAEVADHPLESTLFSVLCLQVYYSYC